MGASNTERRRWLRAKSPNNSDNLEGLLDALSTWKDQPIWFTERLVSGGATSFAQQSFTLRYVQRAPQHVHLTGKWGHDLSILSDALREVKVEARCITTVEDFGNETRRVREFRRLALRDEHATALSAAHHVLFHEGFDVKCLGAKHQWAAWDNLALGSSSLDPAEHARFRALVSRDEGSKPPAPEELLRVIREVGAGPVVFWVGASLREQLGFWCACHTLTTGADALPPLWCAAPRRSGPTARLNVATPERLTELFCDATPITPRALEVFGARWREFCTGAQPREVAILGWPSSKRWMLRVATDFDAQLPSRKAQRTFPSRLDRALLRTFTRWQTPLALVRNAERADFFFRLLGADAALLGRLRAWASYEEGRYLLERPTSEAMPFKRFEYRLTAAGRMLLAKGAASAREFPAFPWGGFRPSSR